MTEGPLNESEMAWLEETLMSYGHDDASVLDVSELDGMFTAVLSGPVVVEPDTWLVAVWGGEKYIPRWKNDREMNRFIDAARQTNRDTWTIKIGSPARS